MSSATKKRPTRLSSSASSVRHIGRTSASKRKHASGPGGNEPDDNMAKLTPRSMIQGLIATAPVEQSVPKRARRTPPPRPAYSPARSPRRSVDRSISQSPRSRRRSQDLRKKATLKNFLQREAADKPTPRTMIASLIDQGMEESMISSQPSTGAVPDSEVTNGGDMTLANLDQTSGPSAEESYLSHYSQSQQSQNAVKRPSPKPARFRNRKPTPILESFTASLNKSLAKHRKPTQSSSFDLDSILEHSDDSQVSKLKTPSSASRRSARPRRSRLGEEGTDSEEDSRSPRSNQQAGSDNHEMVLSVSKTQVVDVIIHSHKDSGPGDEATGEIFENAAEYVDSEKYISEGGNEPADDIDTIPYSQPLDTERNTSSPNIENIQDSYQPAPVSTDDGLELSPQTSPRRSSRRSYIMSKNASPARENLGSSDKNVSSALASLGSPDKNASSARVSLGSPDKNVSSARVSLGSTDKNVSSVHASLGSPNRDVSSARASLGSPDQNAASAHVSLGSPNRDVSSAIASLGSPDKNDASEPECNLSGSEMPADQDDSIEHSVSTMPRRSSSRLSKSKSYSLDSPNQTPKNRTANRSSRFSLSRAPGTPHATPIATGDRTSRRSSRIGTPGSVVFERNAANQNDIIAEVSLSPSKTPGRATRSISRILSPNVSRTSFLPDDHDENDIANDVGDEAEDDPDNDEAEEVQDDSDDEVEESENVSLVTDKLKTPNITTATPRITDYFRGRTPLVRPAQQDQQREVRPPPMAGTSRQATGTKTKKPSPKIPPAILKTWVKQFTKLNVPKETLLLIEELSDKFFTNAVGDLKAYTQHAGRQSITEEDLELLMKRQKFITPEQNLYSLVEKYLPLECRKDIIPCASSGNVVSP